MAENLGASFSIDITQLKAGLAAANRAIRESESEFKAAAAGMGDWTKSQEGLEKRIATLNKTADIQSAKVAALKKEYDRLIAEGLDPTSAKATNLRTQINNETAALEKSKAEIAKQTAALEQMQAESKAAADKTESLTDKVKRQETELADLKKRYTEVAAAQGKNSDEAKALAQEISDLSGDLKDNKAKLKDAADAADDLDKSFEKAEKGGLSSFAVALGNLAANLISAAISKMKDLISNTIEVGQTFEKSMSNVQAISGATAEEMELLTDTAKEYGSSTQFSASEAADALSYMALAGWDANTSASALGGVLDLAAASGMELASASDMVTDYMSAFNMTADKSAYFADVLAYAQGNANTTAAGLGEAFKNCAANLNAAGQDFETTTALLSMMANQGLKGSEAGTALTAVMRDMTAKMKDGKIAIGDASVEVMDAQGNYRDLTDILADVEKAVGGMGDAERATALQSTFTADSIKGLNLILNAGTDEAAKFEDELRKSGGTAGEMAKIMNDNLGGDLTSLGSKFEGIQIALYEKFEPALRKAVEALSGLLDALDWVIKNGGEIAGIITGVGVAVGTFLAIVNRQAILTAFIGLLGKLKAGFLAVNAVMAANPVGLVIAAVAGLVAAFVVLWKKSEKFRNFWKGLWAGIKKTAEPIIKGLAEWFKKAWDKIKKAWSAVGKFFSDIWEKIKNSFAVQKLADYFRMAWENIKAVWSVVVAYFKTIFENIKLVFSAVKKVLSGDFSGAWDAIKQIFSNVKKFFEENVWGAIKNIFANIDEFFGGIFSAAWNKVTEIWGAVAGWFSENVVEPIKRFFSPIIDFFRTAFEIIGQLANGCWNLIKAVWSVVSSWFNTHIIQPVAGFFRSMWYGIKSAAAAAWRGIVAVWTAVSGWFKAHIIDPVARFFSTLWSGIKGAASTAWNGIKSVWAVVSGWFNSTIIQPVQNFFSKMWNGLKNGASQAWTGIKSVFGGVADWFKDKFSKAWQAVKNVFSTGGKVFDGIKDGITSAFKNVVNAIIKGINKVISIPFNAINKTLDKIRGVSIAGIEPFKNLVSRFDVPQIPLLANGGVVRRATGAIIGEDGAEAVVPLEHNTKWMDALAERLADKIGGGVTVNQTNNYSQAHSRYEIYKSKQATAAAVRLALMR